MTFLMSAMLAALLQSSAGWTWTLYEGHGPVVLANEIPDTPELRTTLQCDSGSSAVEVSVLLPDAQPGFARLRAGDATATSEARAERDGRLGVALRTDHPLFAAFSATGDMTVAVGDAATRVTVPSQHLPKLRRFSDLCSG